MKKAIKDGAKAGLKVVWDLGKIMIPTIFLVTFLKYTPIFKTISDFLQPSMSIFGLPGEAAIAIVTGMFLSLYGSIGIMIPLNLTPVQITTIAIMVLTCHGVIIENAILKKLNISILKIFSFRFIVAISLGYMVHLFM